MEARNIYSREGNKQSVDFTFFSEREIDEKFNSVVDKCKDVTCHKEIIKIINQTFYNRLLQINFGFEQDLKVYRVTNFKGLNPESINSFSYSPNPDLGRANIPGKGNSVFYGSLIPLTAVREMKDKLRVGDELYLSEWIIKCSENVLIHTVLNNSVIEDNEIPTSLVANKLYLPFNDLLKNFPEENKRLKYFFKKMGDLFTLGDQYYHITSAYAHEFLFNTMNKRAPIAMIMYPSVACGHNGINLAIHPSFVDGNLMTLNKVLKLELNKLDESSIKVTVKAKGYPKNGLNIEWKNPTISIESIQYNEINIWTDSKQTFQGESALQLSINKNLKTFGHYIKSAINRINLMDLLLKIPFKDDIIEFEYAQRKYFILFYCNTGLKVKIEGRYENVTHILLPIIYIEDYR